MAEKVLGEHGHVGAVEVYIMNAVEWLMSNHSEVCWYTNVDSDLRCLKRLIVVVEVQRMTAGAKKDR